MLKKYLPYLLLAFIGVCVFLQAPKYLSVSNPPLGLDSSSHIVTIQEFTKGLEQGQLNLWNPKFNLGYPIALQYHPMLYILTAPVALLLGGSEFSLLAYKFWILALLALVPFSFFYAFKRLGFNKNTCLAAGLISGTLSSSIQFGYTYQAHLYLNLSALLISFVVLPIAYAECLRYLQAKGKLSIAAITLAILYFSHTFVGVAILPFLILTLFTTGSFTKSKQAFYRLIKLFICLVLLTAFHSIPMLFTLDYLAGWPWEAKEFLHGVGLSSFFQLLVTGKLTDYERFPILLIFTLLGLFFSIRVFTKDFMQRTVLASFLLASIFLIGRTSFSYSVDLLFPINAVMPLIRYFSIFCFFAIFLMAIGCAQLASFIAQRFNWQGTYKSYLLVFILCLYSLSTWYNATASLLRERPQSNVTSSHNKLIQVLKEDNSSGRYFTSSRLGTHGSHWEYNFTAYNSNKPGSISYGSGYHESLNFYFIEQLDFQKYAELYSHLFNTRFLIASPNSPAPDSFNAKRLYQDSNYSLLKLNGDYGYFQFIKNPDVLKNIKPRNARKIIENWLWNKYPEINNFIRFEKPLSFNFLNNNSPLGIEIAPKFELLETSKEAQLEALIIEENNSSNSYQAKVEVKNQATWLLLKVSAHPFWQALVDNQEVEIYHISPSYMAVKVPEGQHEVKFQFKIHTIQKVLFFLALFSVIGLVSRKLF